MATPFDSPSKPSSRDSFGGGSSSDGGSSVAGGPVWLEDPSPKKKRTSLKDVGRAIIANDRMSLGGNAAAARSSGERPMRSPREAIIAFNMPRDRSANKSIKALLSDGHLGAGTAADIARFVVLNDGKLDQSKVADYLGDAGELNLSVLQLLLETLDFEGLPMDSALRKMISLTKLPGESQKIDRMLEEVRHPRVLSRKGDGRRHERVSVAR